MNPASWTIFCDSSELAVVLAQDARDLGLAVQTEVIALPAELTALPRPARAALALQHAPTLAQWATWARAGGVDGPPRPVLSLGATPRQLAFAADLGVPCTHDVRAFIPLLAALQLHPAPIGTSAVRTLSAVTRARLGPALALPVPPAGGRATWSAAAGDQLQLGFGEAQVCVGRPESAAAALLALHAAQPTHLATLPRDRTAQERAQELLFGPARALSDPASKAVLALYGLTLPTEELCQSPSRAAAEASRLGFPVRLTLASPDLRLSDHPALVIEGIDNAARVRESYRALQDYARSLSADARVLGVLVGEATMTRALLRVQVEAIDADTVAVQLGFADAHGVAADDCILTPFPQDRQTFSRALTRLRAHALLGAPGEDAAQVHAGLFDCLCRLATFARDFGPQVDRVILDPLALGLDCRSEVRDARIDINNFFARSLEDDLL
ncbi:MAG: acetate--CoA ligase family protein [Polyangiales bacterium]